ncbi:Spindle pole body component [Wickerhamomyces ciferrii]|uniref:Spindle pole body component n=1 Tax=Wickerhamomyces ciferrii (strain ATCC 14091 / BCRC 22168 / CBS 111 / JCM 3599 / NBRC 0793 / NRRL Y-1031 F-60-10) TaxID=1206466 RepID=K0KTU6_WICCF|nr:Spindle pole body component [Wickerhamomyces ciferrii]CCH46606.1 Spindle pole body component [Wickerhamomyces ciferrii]
MSSNHTEDKENQIPIETEKENRRESFAKGILKRKDDGNHTIEVMPLALRDHQQTIYTQQNQTKKPSRRRVSFHPEVTLHNFKVDTKSSNIEEKQPKRRETIAALPSSCQVSDDDISIPSSSQQNAPTNYPSSDVEMEDDSHVYSSPNRLPTEDQPFAIYNDDESMNETQPYTDDDNTMDLTKPLGNIQQLSLVPLDQRSSFPEPSSQLESQHQDSSDELTSSRPFGSLKDLFQNDTVDEANEADMDLTQPYSEKTNNIVDEINEPDMDLTQPFSNNRENTEEIDQLNNGSNLATRTSSSISTDDAITKQNTYYNTELQKEFDDTANDTTQAMEIDETQFSIADQTEVSMEVTRIASDHSPLPQPFESLNSQKSPALTTKSNKSNSMTPLRTSKSHTSETGSPMSSKRKHQLNESATLNLREKINSLTPKKRRKSTGERKSITSNRQSLQPSIFSGPLIIPQDLMRSSFTPLRSAKEIHRTSLLPNKHTFETTTLVPLQEPSQSEEDDDYDDDEYAPVPLKQFLEDLGVEFFDNLNINEDFTVVLNQIENNTEVKKIDYLKAKSIKIPWLELYSFSCSELQKDMSKLKLFLDNYNDEFIEENPQLVREYYQIRDTQEQRRLSDSLLLMKTLSDKEAEVSWLEWSYQLLNELDNRLIDHLDIIEKDSINISNKVKELTNFEEELDLELENLSEQMNDLIEQNEIFQASQNEDVMQTRNNLYKILKDLNNQEENLEKCQIKNDELSQKVSQYKEIEEIVEQKEHIVKINGMDLDTRVQIWTKQFVALQSISGIKLLSLNDTILNVSFASNMITASIDLTKINESDSRIFEINEKLPDLTKKYIEIFINKLSKPEMDLIKQFNQISNVVKSLNWFHRELYYLGLLSPIKTEMNDDCLILKIKDINRNEGYKTEISIEIPEYQLYTNLQPSKISTKVIYGSISEKDLILKNWKSKSHSTSWIRSI